MQWQPRPKPEPEPEPITLVTKKIKYGDREKSRLVGTQLRGTPIRRNHLNVCMTPVAATWTPPEGTRPQDVSEEPHFHALDNANWRRQPRGRAVQGL